MCNSGHAFLLQAGGDQAALNGVWGYFRVESCPVPWMYTRCQGNTREEIK